MNSYNGYKLKPKEYSIQPNDVIIRVKGRMSFITNGQIALALGDNDISTYLHKTWTTSYSDWRAIETKPGQKAVAGDTVYCIKSTGGACNQHDSFRITDYSNRNFLSPEEDHILLNGTITGQGWNWKAINFVVLVKADSKELQEFPCFRRAIKNKHIVKFISPREGTIAVSGNSGLPLEYTSNWADCNEAGVWEPCEDPALSHTPVDPFKAKPGDYVEWADESTPSLSMTKGQLYKVINANSSGLVLLNNHNHRDFWKKLRFKRVPDKAIQEPVLISSDDHIDSLAYALRMPIPHISIDYSMMHKPTQIKPRETSFPIYKIKTGEEIICVGKDKQGWFKSVNSKGNATRHNPIFHTLDKPKQTNSKGKQMNSNLFTDILKLLTQTAQTDLEKAPSTYAFFYNNEGEYEGTARVANEAEAKALLQKPEHLGYTMRIYSFSDEFTTQIPVVSTIKKVVKPEMYKAPKAPRKPRAPKAI